MRTPSLAMSRIAAQVDATIAAIETKLGAPDVLIHNAVGGAFGSFLEIDPEVLNRNFQVNTMGLLYLARRVAPGMAARGKGAIIVTGNTSALRGRPNFAGFAPTKAAQRILAEAMARELGPKGVHVAYVVIDAVIDSPRQRERISMAAPAISTSSRAAIADECFHRRALRIAAGGRSRRSSAVRRDAASRVGLALRNRRQCLALLAAARRPHGRLQRALRLGVPMPMSQPAGRGRRRIREGLAGQTWPEPGIARPAGAACRRHRRGRSTMPAAKAREWTRLQGKPGAGACRHGRFRGMHRNGCETIFAHFRLGGQRALSAAPGPR